jgi:hypothetical protein
LPVAAGWLEYIEQRVLRKNMESGGRGIIQRGYGF